MNELALFAGAGGGILGGHLLGWRTVCAVEWGEYPASVLCARQNEGLLPPFPIWDDVQTFDGRPWRGLVDVVSGGFPCQDISVAGKGEGITGERSGMWSHMARIIGEVRPRFAYVENSPALLTRGLGTVLSDLAALGYDCRWTVLGAADVGANHQRDRFWLVATQMVVPNSDMQSRCAESWEQQSRPTQPQGSGTKQLESGANVATDTLRDGFGQQPDEHITGQLESAAHVGADGAEEPLADANDSGQRANSRPGCGSECAEPGHDIGRCGEAMADTDRERLQEFNPAGIATGAGRTGGQLAEIGRADWWAVEPDVRRVAHGVAARVDRIKAIGNGQVPLCAATAWNLLKEAA